MGSDPFYPCTGLSFLPMLFLILKIPFFFLLIHLKGVGMGMEQEHLTLKGT